ncbi:hypothetical protein ABID23_000642 [Bartonella silvatica]|uniref:Uncharacterized protein n=1 Tax=Bartonella silvatica TaxID=357760 RepID=A0ABV2HG85_9HYPH
MNRLDVRTVTHEWANRVMMQLATSIHAFPADH